MDDPFSQTTPYVLANYRPMRMLLSPRHWKTYAPSQQLDWKKTKFDRANRIHVPADERGVYSFLIHPDVANHHAIAYLMYVGKAEEQSLRERYLQYFDHLTDTSRRVNISKMLQLWDGHLWFWYAPVADHATIDDTEQALLNTFLPPFNLRYKGAVSRELKFLNV